MAPRQLRIFSENNDFQHAEVLRRNRQKRQHYREFFLEGVRPINLALLHGWEIKSFFFSTERGLSDWARDILRHSTASTHVEVPLSLLQKLSNKDETSELIAIVGMPPDDLSRIAIRQNLLVVVFDRPASPGNLGSLIRSCDALGVHGVVMTGHGADLYDPETISASRGSIFAIPVTRVSGPNDLLPWFNQIQEVVGQLQLVACDEKAESPVWTLDFRRPTVLLLGNERRGLSAAYREIANTRVRIPMSGAATSLNVAVAGSIVLYEVMRQRQDANS
jgi:TrmH family RNA methyltransferase